MSVKKILVTIFLLLYLSNEAYSDIPLDSINGKTWILSKTGKGETLNGWVGRANPWRVREENKFAIAASLQIPNEQDPWKGFFRISESMPLGATDNPHLREWNLPDLLDRLSLEGALPHSVEKITSSDSSLTLIIKEPTVISASISTYRQVKIINKSHLILLCPLCQTITVENEHDKAITEVYSYFCTTSPQIGSIKRYKLADWLVPCTNEVDIAPTGTLSGLSELPQVIIGQFLGRKPIELLEMWSELYKISI